VVARIAHRHLRNQRLDQLRQPGGMSAFFKGHFDPTAQAAKEVAEMFGFCFDRRPALEVAGFMENNNHGNLFVNIHAHILDTIHLDASLLLVILVVAIQDYDQRGVLSYYVSTPELKGVSRNSTADAFVFSVSLVHPARHAAPSRTPRSLGIHLYPR